MFPARIQVLMTEKEGDTEVTVLGNSKLLTAQGLGKICIYTYCIQEKNISIFDFFHNNFHYSITGNDVLADFTTENKFSSFGKISNFSTRDRSYLEDCDTPSCCFKLPSAAVIHSAVTQRRSLELSSDSYF